MVSWFHLHPNLTNSLNQIVECELSGFSAHAVASSPDPHRRHSQDWWRAESSALWAAPGLWRCCRNERYNQNLWCTQCNRGRCVQDVRRHSWGTTAGSFQSAPSFWSGTTFYSRRLQTTPEVMKTKRRRMRQIWKCFQQMLVEIELTRHLTFMPSMYFFSGFLRTMSERWFRGTRPLMWSVRCTTIPWFNRTDTLPWKKNMSKERSDMKDSRNSPLQGQCHVYTYTYMCVYENNTHMHNICLTSTTWPALTSWYLKKGFSMILLGIKKKQKTKFKLLHLANAFALKLVWEKHEDTNLLAQTHKVDLVHETEVQDPAGVLRHCLQFVLVGWFMQLFQMVPLPIPPKNSSVLIWHIT